MVPTKSHHNKPQDGSANYAIINISKSQTLVHLQKKHIQGIKIPNYIPEFRYWDLTQTFTCGWVDLWVFWEVGWEGPHPIELREFTVFLTSEWETGIHRKPQTTQHCLLSLEPLQPFSSIQAKSNLGWHIQQVRVSWNTASKITILPDSPSMCWKCKDGKEKSEQW